jgi:hypothetical protein
VNAAKLAVLSEASYVKISVSSATAGLEFAGWINSTTNDDGSARPLSEIVGGKALTACGPTAKLHAASAVAEASRRATCGDGAPDVTAVIFRVLPELPAAVVNFNAPDTLSLSGMQTVFCALGATVMGSP